MADSRISIQMDNKDSSQVQETPNAIVPQTTSVIGSGLRKKQSTHPIQQVLGKEFYNVFDQFIELLEKEEFSHVFDEIMELLQEQIALEENNALDQARETAISVSQKVLGFKKGLNLEDAVTVGKSYFRNYKDFGIGLVGLSYFPFIASKYQERTRHLPHHFQPASPQLQPLGQPIRQPIRILPVNYVMTPGDLVFLPTIPMPHSIPISNYMGGSAPSIPFPISASALVPCIPVAQFRSFPFLIPVQVVNSLPPHPTRIPLLPTPPNISAVNFFPKKRRSASEQILSKPAVLGSKDVDILGVRTRSRARTC